VKNFCADSELAHFWLFFTPIPADPQYTKAEPIRKRVNPRNGVKLSSGSYAHPWDGRPQYWSSYA
ncbi:hypothetical protein ABQ013_22280, partial [Xanthomonas citri pv. malvacearum]